MWQRLAWHLTANRARHGSHSEPLPTVRPPPVLQAGSPLRPSPPGHERRTHRQTRPRGVSNPATCLRHPMAPGPVSRWWPQSANGCTATSGHWHPGTVRRPGLPDPLSREGFHVAGHSRVGGTGHSPSACGPRPQAPTNRPARDRRPMPPRSCAHGAPMGPPRHPRPLGRHARNLPGHGTNPECPVARWDATAATPANR